MKHEIKTETGVLERGAAFVELVLTLPIVLFIALQVVEFGQQLSQASWLSQTAYQVAFAGSESIEAERPAQMEGTMARLVQVHNLQTRKTPVSKTEVKYEELPGRIMAATVEAEVKSLWQKDKAQRITLRMKSPILVAAASITEEMGRFSNPSKRYDCCGRECSGGGCPVSCVSCDSSPGGRVGKGPGFGASSTVLLSEDADESCSVVAECE